MASKNISFETIPSAIRVPGRYIEFNTKLAMRTLPANAQKVLLIAQQLPTGTIPALTPTQVFSDDEAANLFGAGSWAHLLTRQAIRNNQYMDLSVIGVEDDAAGIQAVGDLTISGAAGSSGQVIVNVGLEDYRIAVTSKESTTSIMDRLIEVLNQDPDSPVVAAKADNKITLTAKHAGETGNEITISIRTTSRDLIVSSNPMANGEGNPNIVKALAEVAGKHYHIIISPFSDDPNLQSLSEHIENVSNAIEKRGAIGVAAWKGSLSTGTTQAAKLNDGRLTMAWYRNAAVTNGMIAAGYGAVIAFEEDPARPLNTLEIKGLGITQESDWPMFTEQNNALYNGLTPLTIVNNRVQILRAISTYTKNATGTDDPALLDITTIRTLDYVRTAVDQRIALRFPREKLSNKTPPKVRSEILDVLYKMEELEILEEVAANQKLLIVERDLQDPNRLNVAIPADVVNGLHVFAARIDLYL